MQAHVLQFVASPVVQDHLMDIWCDDFLWKDFFLYIFCTITFILPFLQLYKGKTKQFFPSTKYWVNIFSRILFAVLLLTNIGVFQLQMRTSPSVLDHLIFVFTLALLLQVGIEFCYLRGSFQDAKSVSDVISILNQNMALVIDLLCVILFVLYWIFIMIGFYSDRYELLRCSFYLSGFGTLLACIRPTWCFQMFKSLGPVHISLGKIMLTVSFFLLIIMPIFILAFAAAIANIYSADLLLSRNSSNVTQVPPAVDGLVQVFLNLLWTVLGESLNIPDYESSSDVQTAIGTFTVALFRVVAVITLLAALGALVSSIMTTVKENADVEWKFARACIIGRMKDIDIVPIPINLLYCSVKLVICLCCCCQTKKTCRHFSTSKCCASAQKKSDQQADDFTVKLRRRYEYSKEKRENDEWLSKGDMKKILYDLQRPSEDTQDPEEKSLLHLAKMLELRIRLWENDVSDLIKRVLDDTKHIKQEMRQWSRLSSRSGFMRKSEA
jgi:hypothetical protein